jgi:hypothetical protein
MRSKTIARYLAVAIMSSCLGGLFTPASFGATQGTSGATSTGTVNISASVASRVRITNLSDVSFSKVDVTADVSNAQNVCVWSNTATKGYNITATGNGASNAFTLNGGAGTSPMPYSVAWNQSSGQTSGTALSKGVALTGLVSTATNQNCASGPSSSASLIISILAADLASAVSSATYSGVLTLVVAPE